MCRDRPPARELRTTRVKSHTRRQVVDPNEIFTVRHDGWIHRVCRVAELPQVVAHAAPTVESTTTLAGLACTSASRTFAIIALTSLKSGYGSNMGGAE